LSWIGWKLATLPTHTMSLRTMPPEAQRGSESCTCCAAAAVPTWTRTDAGHHAASQAALSTHHCLPLSRCVPVQSLHYNTNKGTQNCAVKHTSKHAEPFPVTALHSIPAKTHLGVLAQARTVLCAPPATRKTQRPTSTASTLLHPPDPSTVVESE